MCVHALPYCSSVHFSGLFSCLPTKYTMYWTFPEGQSSHLALPVMWVPNWVWVEALVVLRWEQQEPLVTPQLGKQILLLVVVHWRYVAWIPKTKWNFMHNRRLLTSPTALNVTEQLFAWYLMVSSKPDHSIGSLKHFKLSMFLTCRYQNWGTLLMSLSEDTSWKDSSLKM